MNPITKKYQRSQSVKESLSREAEIRRSIPLVRRVAYRIAAHLPSSVEVSDLISAGCVGLLLAFERFDPEVGLDFSTFAEYRIKGAILDSLRTLDPLPRRSRKKIQDIERTRKKLTGVLGRPPDDDEMAEEMGMTAEAYTKMVSGLSPCMGLSYVLLDGAAALKASEANDSRSPHDALERRQLRRALVRAIRELPDRERTVVSLYYYSGLSYREIAALYDVTESRICQIHRAAAKRLKAAIVAEWEAEPASTEKCDAAALKPLAVQGTP